MTKKILIAVLIGAALTAFYQYKKKSNLGLSIPKIETEESIQTYADEHRIAGDILIAKDKASYNIVKKLFDWGNLYVLDGNLNLVDCSFQSLGGRCYQDIHNDICEDIDIPMRAIPKLTGKQVMDSLINNTINITREDSLQFQTYDRIYIYTWVKYVKLCVDESSIKFTQHLAEKPDNKSLVLTVNTDSLIQFR